MNKFPWDCGECPMLRTYDMSIDDLTHICLWSKKQIDDCDRYKSAECPLEEHDAKVRADAIEECIAKISREHTHSAYNDDVYEAIMLLEQLKGQNK